MFYRAVIRWRVYAAIIFSLVSGVFISNVSVVGLFLWGCLGKDWCSKNLSFGLEELWFLVVIALGQCAYLIALSAAIVVRAVWFFHNRFMVQQS